MRVPFLHVLSHCEPSTRAGPSCQQDFYCLCSSRYLEAEGGEAGGVPPSKINTVMCASPMYETV